MGKNCEELNINKGINKDKNGWLKKTSTWMIILANEQSRNKEIKIKVRKQRTLFQDKQLSLLGKFISQDDLMEPWEITLFLGTALVCYNTIPKPSYAALDWKWLCLMKQQPISNSSNSPHPLYSRSPKSGTIHVIGDEYL